MYWALQALQINWTAEEFSLKGDTLLRVLLPNGDVEEVTIEELYAICNEE